MQRGGGGRHRAGVFGEHGLVTLRVLRRVRVSAVLLACNIGRQRNMAVALHQRVRVVARVVGQHKAKQRPGRIGPAPQQCGAQAVGVAGRAVQRHGFAHSGLFAHAQMRGHLVAAKHAFDQEFELAAGGFFAKQAGIEHLGVVEHQQVARAQQAGEFVKDAVHRLGARGVKQARAAALGCGLLGDEVFGQGEIKIAQGVGGCHGA